MEVRGPYGWDEGVDAFIPRNDIIVDERRNIPVIPLSWRYYENDGEVKEIRRRYNLYYDNYPYHQIDNDVQYTSPGQKGTTPVMFALANGHHDVVEWLEQQ